MILVSEDPLHKLPSIIVNRYNVLMIKNKNKNFPLLKSALLGSVLLLAMILMNMIKLPHKASAEFKSGNNDKAQISPNPTEITPTPSSLTPSQPSSAEPPSIDSLTTENANRQLPHEAEYQNSDKTTKDIFILFTMVAATIFVGAGVYFTRKRVMQQKKHSRKKKL